MLFLTIIAAAKIEQYSGREEENGCAIIIGITRKYNWKLKHLIKQIKSFIGIIAFIYDAAAKYLNNTQ